MATFIAIIVGFVIGAATGREFGLVGGPVLGWLIVRSLRQQSELGALRERLAGDPLVAKVARPAEAVAPTVAASGTAAATGDAGLVAAALAVIGALGGFAAPLLLATGAGNHVALFSYYLVLDLGIAAIAWVNSSLLFGLPTIVFVLQYGLVEDTAYGAALSALVLGAFYVALAAWMRKRPELGITFEASLGVAVVFITQRATSGRGFTWRRAATLAGLRDARPRRLGVPHIRDDVDDDQPCPERPLHAARQPRRIDDRQQIVLDEAAAIARLAGLRPQAILERRQRADSARELDPCTPCQRRQMNERQPPPAQRREAAGDDEDDECQVDDDHGIGGEGRQAHRLMRPARRNRSRSDERTLAVAAERYARPPVSSGQPAA